MTKPDERLRGEVAHVVADAVRSWRADDKTSLPLQAHISRAVFEWLTEREANR